jgi:hypothetical protein
MNIFLSIDSIKSRYKEDIDNFLKEYKTKNYKRFSLIEAQSYNIMKETMDMLSSEIQKLLKEYPFKKFNYHKDIYKFDPDIQQKLWIIRTYIFYQMLIFLIEIASGKVHPLFPLEDIKINITIEELSKCKIEISGSNTPTSDIDIGIKYFGKDIISPFLWWILSIYENLFTYILGKKSLDLDIETVIWNTIIPNKDYKKDLYYLNTSKFSLRHFEQILPYIGCSILRNAVIAQEELHNKSDIHNQTLDIFIDNFSFPLHLYLPDTTIPNYKNIKKIWENEKWQKKAKKIISDYKLNNYDYQRKKYYELTKEVEKINLTIRKQFLESKNLKEPKISIDKICKLMVKICHAEVYREENYVCPTTVLHVVKILQNKNHIHEIKCESPLPPKCIIGYYGYLISMLEQRGYLNRFSITYCQYRNFDKTKCIKKYEKYFKRYIDALERIQEFKY